MQYDSQSYLPTRQSIWPVYLLAERREIDDITRSFKERAGIDGVIGACDGSHVRILCSDKNQQKAYCNRKGFHSMILQVFNLNNGISVIIA